MSNEEYNQIALLTQAYIAILLGESTKSITHYTAYSRTGKERHIDANQRKMERHRTWTISMKRFLYDNIYIFIN